MKWEKTGFEVWVFKFNSYRYNVYATTPLMFEGANLTPYQRLADAVKVGLCTLNQVDS
jgi:hypothetical protein